MAVVKHNKNQPPPTPQEYIGFEKKKKKENIKNINNKH